jgi:hypothetical protein
VKIHLLDVGEKEYGDAFLCEIVVSGKEKRVIGPQG